MTATTTKVCPDWCNSPYPSHLEWQDRLPEPGTQDRTHVHNIGGNVSAAAEVCMDEVLDPKTGTVTSRKPYVFISIDEFEDIDISARVRELAADLVAAADKLDEILAAQR